MTFFPSLTCPHEARIFACIATAAAVMQSATDRYVRCDAHTDTCVMCNQMNSWLPFCLSLIVEDE